MLRVVNVADLLVRQPSIAGIQAVAGAAAMHCVKAQPSRHCAKKLTGCIKSANCPASEADWRKLGTA